MNPTGDTKKNAQTLSRCFRSLFSRKSGAVAHFTDIISETSDVNESLIVEVKKMRRLRLVKKQAKIETEAYKEPNAKKGRPSDKVTTIFILDNDTMVEAFKFLNYCQLAINSLVSKRFCDLIQTHRHSLALIYVDYIAMNAFISILPSVIKIFDQTLSPEAYNKWVVRNHYSKQASLEDQTSTENILNDYLLVAYAHYKDPNHRKRNDSTSVLFAQVELNQEYWPVFEHFVHLLADPLIRIRYAKFTPQADVFNLLVATFDCNNLDSLQCEKMHFNFEDNSLKIFNWIKDHVCCVKFRLADSNQNANRDKQLLDFFATGSHCASDILVTHSHLLKAVIVGLVEKFMDFKSCDESQIVHSIRGTVIKPTAEAFKSNYAKFFIEEEDENGWNTVHIYEFVNADIGKKMRLTVSNSATHQVTLKIINL